MFNYRDCNHHQVNTETAAEYDQNMAHSLSFFFSPETLSFSQCIFFHFFLFSFSFFLSSCFFFFALKSIGRSFILAVFHMNAL